VQSAHVADSQVDSMKRRRMPLELALLSALLWPLSACDQYADLKTGLSPEEVARFERGQGQATPCWTCHDITGPNHKVGPALQGLIGRPAGTAEGFSYSPAFQGASLVWSSRTLDTFLRDPQRIVPGNRMLSPGLTDPRRRADLVFFLERATAPR
jgi:cytochrome c